MTNVICTLILVTILSLLFFLVSKMDKWENSMASSFECGFSSYFFSRFSFSIHYFIVALIFLFLDLELCFMMPFFNENFSETKNFMSLIFIVVTLLIGLMMEWKEGKLEWMF